MFRFTNIYINILKYIIVLIIYNINNWRQLNREQNIYITSDVPKYRRKRNNNIINSN
jgi:hypothetical protein